MKRKTEVDLTSGNLFSKLFFVALPLIFSGILQLLYNAADLIVCGMFGSKHAVAAISPTNPLINLIVNLFLGLSVGANVLMARCYGEKNKEKAQKVAYTAMMISLISGVVIAIFGFLMANTFLNLMGTPSDVIDLSCKYLKIYFIGIPFSMIYNFGSSLLRAVGDTKRPFYFLSFAGIFNVLLNLLFVIVFNMDVAGVALATIIAQCISAILIFICLLKNKGFFIFNIKEIKFYKKEALEILRIGLPAGIQGTIFSLSNVLIQSSVNSLGTNVMDGNGSSSSLEGFVYTSMNSVATACIAFVSANFGAKNKENIKKSILSSCALIVLMDLFVGGLILLFSNQLLSLYISSEEAMQAAKSRLFIIVSTYFICGIMDTFAYSLREIGYSLTPTIVSLIGVCGIRIIWLLTVFKIDRFHNVSCIALSYPISWIITASVHIILFICLFKKIDYKQEKALI